MEPGRPPRPVQLDLVFRTERGTPVNPNHASRAFARLAASIGLDAHPHLLRHTLPSAGATGLSCARSRVDDQRPGTGC